MSSSVIKAYVKAGTYKLFFIVLLFEILSIIGQVFTNIWLSAWSDDANKNITDPARQSKERLAVYGALAGVTSKHI